MSVNRIAATPASSNRLPSSTGVSSRHSAQPWVAILPPLASAPTTIRPGNLRAASFTKSRIGQGRRAQDHAGDAGRQPAFHRRHVADAAAQLDGKVDGGADGLDRFAVGAVAGEGAVEIDAVQPFKTLGREGRACAAGSALNTVASSITPFFRRTQWPSFRSMAGKMIMGRHLRKFSSSFRPVAWLFSGWNWVPAIFSLPIMAVSAPP